jgi:tetratricopeptide (TPR) repeat protein
MTQRCQALDNLLVGVACGALLVALAASPARADSAAGLEPAIEALDATPLEAVHARLDETIAVAAELEIGSQVSVALVERLGDRARQLGRPARAIELYERVFAAHRASGAAGGAGAARSALAIGEILEQRGDDAGAQAWLREAVGLGERTAMERLARLLARTEDPEGEALALFERSLEGGDEPSRTLKLALFHRDRGDHERAAAELTARLALVSPTRPWFEASSDLLMLAKELAAAGQVEPAERRFGEALAAAEARHGKRHPSLVPVLVELGRFELERGRTAEAEGRLLRALELARTAWGDCPICNQDLLSLLEQAGRRAEALGFCTGEDDIPGSSAVATPEQDALRERLAGLDRQVDEHVARRELAEAHAIARETLALREEAYGPESLEVLPSLSHLVRIASAIARPADEQALIERQLAILQGYLATDDPRLGGLVSRLAQLAQVAKDSERETRYLAWEQRLRERAGQNLRDAGILVRLSALHRATDLRRAGDLVLDASERWRTMASEASTEYARLRIDLAGIYRELGMSAEAEATLAELAEIHRARPTQLPEIEREIEKARSRSAGDAEPGGPRVPALRR